MDLKVYLTNVFIYADLDARIRRIARIYNLTDAKAKDMILKTDKKRASYYNYYTSKKWGDTASYDLCINTSKISVDNAVDLILDFRKYTNLKTKSGIELS